MNVRAVIKEAVGKRHRDIRSALKCSICLDLFTEPIRLNVCGHTFCLKCYLTLFTSLASPKTVLCPLCKQPTQRRAYVADEDTERAVDRLRDVERDVLSNLDETLDSVQQNINERKFVRTMQRKNNLQRWLDKGREHNDAKRNYTVLDTTSEESGSDDDADSLNHPDNLKVIGQLDLLYFAKPKRKQAFRRTKSLTNIVTKAKRRAKKRHSTGNVRISDSDAADIADDDVDAGRKETEDNRILHLLEEDVLNNFEMEMFAGETCSEAGAAGMDLRGTRSSTPKKNSAGKKRNMSREKNESSVDVSLNASTAWSRMNSMRKEIKKTEVKTKGRQYKQLGLSAEVPKSTGSGLTNERRPKVVNLDDFEAYLSKNLAQNDGMGVDTPTVEIKVERDTSYEDQNALETTENAGLDEADDIFAVCTQKLNVTEIEATEPQPKDTQRRRARKQQLIPNDLDEMCVLPEHDLNKSNANVSVDVHRSLNGTVVMEDLQSQEQTEKDSVAESVGRAIEPDDKKSSRKVADQKGEEIIARSSNDELVSSAANVTDAGHANGCLDSVPVRRSARIRKSNAQMVKQTGAKKDSPRAANRKPDILQKPIESAESQTDVQEEFQASLKSVLDQHTNMAASLQNSLHESTKMLANLSGYLTNSESLFTQSSCAVDKAPSVHSWSELENLGDKPATKWPEHCLSLPLFSGAESEEYASFFHTAIPLIRNLHSLYGRLKVLSNGPRTDNETENFTSIFSKSLLANGDSSKQSTANVNVAKVGSEASYAGVAVQTDRLTCPECSYRFDMGSTGVVPAPAEFSGENDSSIAQSASSQSAVSVLRDEPCRLATGIGSQDQSSSGSEIRCGRKVNRQLFSSNESEPGEQRKFKRIRTPTSDSDSGPVRAKRAKSNGGSGKKLYREDLDVVFESEAREPDVFGGHEGIEYYEYMKKWLKRHDGDMEDNAAEIDGNEARQARNAGKTARQNKNTKQNTQDIAAAYEKILEQEFKTVQFTKPQPLQVVDQFDTIPNTVLDNLCTNISFEKAANSTVAEKPADKSQDTVLDRSEMTASLFAGTETTQNRSKGEERNRADTLLPAADTSLVRGKKSVVEDLTVDDTELDNEVANITSTRHDSMDSDKDMFGEDDVVESTPHKELLAEGDRAKRHISANPILELLDPPDTAADDFHGEWLGNIAPPSEFQDSEQMRPASPEKHPAINFNKFTLTAGQPDANQSALNKGFRGSQLNTVSDNVTEPANQSCHSNVNVDNAVLNSKDSVARAAEPRSTGWLSSSKNLNPLVLARKDKFSPLQIVVNRSPVPCSTPKQKSIRSYMSTPQQNENTPGRATPLHTTASSEPKKTPAVTTTSSCSEKSGIQINTKKYNTSSNSETTRSAVYIASTRLRKDELLAIHTLTSKYKAYYSKEFTGQVTHLVVTVNEQNRVQDHTIKYILAIAHGLWIVSFAWVKDCLLHGRFVSEEAYEVLDVSGCPGPRLSRLSRASYPLLSGYVIHCAEPYMSVNRTDLETAIISLGGRIVPSLADLARDTSKLRLILSEAKVTQDFDHYEMWRQEYKTLVVDIEWLSRSVGQYRVVSARSFILCLEDGIDNMGYPYALVAVVPETPTQLTN